MENSFGRALQQSGLPSCILEEIVHIVETDAKDVYLEHGLLPKAQHPLFEAALVCKDWLAAVRKVLTVLSCQVPS